MGASPVLGVLLPLAHNSPRASDLGFFVCSVRSTVLAEATGEAPSSDRARARSTGSPTCRQGRTGF